MGDLARREPHPGGEHRRQCRGVPRPAGQAARGSVPWSSATSASNGVSFTPNENSYTNGKVGIRLLVSGNNIFPRGRSVVHLKNSNRCVISANRFQAFYPGMIDMEGVNKENLIAGNHHPAEPL